MRAASFTVCWSPSITAHGTLSFRRIKVSVSSVVLPEPWLETKVEYQLIAGSKARAVAFSQTVVFVQHVNFDFQHPTLAHARRVSARFAMTVMQVAFFSLAGG